MKNQNTKFISFSIFISIFLLSVQIKAQDSLSNCMEKGRASYYAKMFEGRKTSNGEIFKNSEYTAAHRTLPFGTLVKVTNLNNYESVLVRINDRGPFVKNRIIDLSRAAAKEIDLLHAGVAKVLIECIFIPTENNPEIFNDKQMDSIEE